MGYNRNKVIRNEYRNQATRIQTQITGLFNTYQQDRSSRPEVFFKKAVLRNFAKFTGKHLCQSLFFIKVTGLRPATLSKKRLWHRCFPVNYAKFLRTPFIHKTPLVAASDRNPMLRS